jgi:hypothetical protein
MKDRKERRRRSDVEVAAASYPFLVEGAAERWLVLICNNLSFGQVELARALVRQLAAVEPATAHALLRRLAFHGLPALAKWYNLARSIIYLFVNSIYLIIDLIQLN